MSAIAAWRLWCRSTCGTGFLGSFGLANSAKTVLPWVQPAAIPDRNGSSFRYPEIVSGFKVAYPNRLPNLTHHRHQLPAHTYGVQKESRLRVVCNSKIGREAMAEGRPPKIIHVYSPYRRKKPHSSHGKLGDRVLVAIKGELKKGILVGLKVNQLPGIPRFDSNNVVLIDDTGSPLGNRINVPVPNCIRPILQKNSHPKKADYTKLLAIATKFV